MPTLFSTITASHELHEPTRTYGVPKGKGEKNGSSQPQDDPKQTVSARIPGPLYRVLKKFADDHRPKTDVSAVIEDALELYLREKGVYPPMDSEEVTSQ